MSTSPTLPAGFFITTILGQRCTAVPRSLTTLTGSEATEAAAAQPPTSTTSTTSTTAPSSTLNVVNTAGGTPIISSTTARVVSTSVAPATTSIPNGGSFTAAAASPASKGTTLKVSSSTQRPIAQSEISTSATRVSSIVHSSSRFLTSKTSAPSSLISVTAAVESSAAAGISSNINPASVIGGVLGSMGFIALVALIFWFFKRRRRTKRESLLTPLTTGVRSSFYADEPPAPGGDGSKWNAGLGYQTGRFKFAGAGLKESLVGLGASLKSKVARDRGDTPGVNLNRGNSQFLDGPIPQHSRNNSVLPSNAGNVTLKQKVTDWWERLGEKLNFNWRLRRKTEETADPFASARSMSEKQAKMNNPPDFSQLLGMDEGNLHLQAEQRRTSLARGTSTMGSLGLSFSSITNPDPFVDLSPTPKKAKANPFADPSNPFLDPPSRPEPSMSKENTSIADIPRSREQSIDATTTLNNASASIYQTRPPSTIAGSRYPSTIAPSRDSYRDTFFSTFSNVRKGKGRSDPFDLERPELWRPRVESQDIHSPAFNSANTQAQRGSFPANTPGKAQGILGIDFNGQPGKRVDSNLTYSSSKYSSMISGLSEWGDPGPDVEPGSFDGNSSLRAVASSDGYGSDEYADNGQDSYAQQLRAQGHGGVSPMSEVSSKGGVGKAM